MPSTDLKVRVRNNLHNLRYTWKLVTIKDVFDWLYSGIRIEGINSRNRLTLLSLFCNLQNCLKWNIKLNGPKITVEGICDKTLYYSYSGIRSIERTRSVQFATIKYCGRTYHPIHCQILERDHRHSLGNPIYHEKVHRHDFGNPICHVVVDRRTLRSPIYRGKALRHHLGVPIYPEVHCRTLLGGHRHNVVPCRYIHFDSDEARVYFASHSLYGQVRRCLYRPCRLSRDLVVENVIKIRGSSNFTSKMLHSKHYSNKSSAK